MAEKRKSLGRGLDALLGGAAQEQEKPNPKSLNELPIEEIGPGPFQPRKKINEQQLKELSSSIEAQGVLQPIVVRKRAVQDSQTGVRYEIIAGERRWRAAQLANLESIPAVVKTISDSDAVAVALIENIQRENLNPLEEANAFNRLIIEYEMTHQEVANAVGRARASISNILRLLDLPSGVQELLNNAKINMGHARSLLSIQDRVMQLEVANLVAEKKLSVRETEKKIALIEERIKDRYNIKVPENIDLEVAATLMTKGLTTFYLLHKTYPVKPRKISIGILFSQLGIGFLTALLFLMFSDFTSAKSSLLGSLIAVITSVNFMNIVLQKRHQEPRKILNSLYLMEAFKFLLTGVFFGVAIILIKAMFFPLIIGYIVAVFIYWLSLLAA